MADQDVWYITDTHWNLNGIDTYCVRPPNYNQRIQKNWGQIVKPNDLVIHGGDVVIGGYETAAAILASLPGNKVLVMGNHDVSKSALWWMRNGFSFAAEGFLYRDVWFTHKPAFRLPYGATINIHGHMHINRRAWPTLKPFNKLFCLEYGLEGKESSRFSPVKLDKLVASKKITELGDDFAHPLPF